MVQVSSYAYLRGLDLNSNPYAPATGKDAGGVRLAATIADNCVLTRQRMIGNRRGFDYFTQETNNQVDRFFEYQGAMIEHESNGTLFQSDPTTGVRSSYTGNYLPPSPYRTDGAVGRGSLFFTSTNGVQKLDSISGNPTRAGLTKALDVRGTTTGTGNGFLGGFSKVGYHITWTKTDANKQTLRSDVSTKLVVTNSTQVSTTLTSSGTTATATTATAHGFSTGDLILIAGATPSTYNGTFAITVTSGTTFTYTFAGGTSPATGTINSSKAQNVTLTFTVPWDVPAGASYEVWRTAAVDASNADPGDDCYLVASNLNTTAAGGTVTFVDTTSDSIVTSSAALYTNATQQGALQGNSRPPYCAAITTYKDYTIFANTAIDHQLTLNLLAVINLVAGISFITIHDSSGSRDYIANGSENIAANQFQLFSGGVSNAFNIENTVRSLVHVINGDSLGRWYAEYTSGINDNPGIFRIWARQAITGSFWLTANNVTTGNQFTPTVPASGTSVISSNDARPNRLFYSKFEEPDHVPILNTIDAGRLDQPILRILSVRDACYIIKSDGVYYLSGLDAPFSLTELDTTCQCIAPATAVTLNNQIFMLSNQGVVKLSLSGVTVISFDVEPIIMGNILSLSNLAAIAFGIANESERNYILYLPNGSGNVAATQAYVFHTFIQEWVRWTKPAVAGIVLNSNYSLYLSSGIENAILKQRKTGDNTDYSDEELDITISSQTGLVVTVNWNPTQFTPTAGLSLHQGSNVAKVLVATFQTGTTWKFTIDRNVTYSGGSATARMPIYAQVRLSPNTCGDPGIVKQIYDVSFLLDSNSATSASIEVSTNEGPIFNAYPIVRALSSGFGLAPWGNVIWGDAVNAAATTPWEIALPIPDMTGESVSMGWYHSVSQEQFIIAKVSVTFDQAAEYQVTG